METLFDEFSQYDAEKNRNVEGTGLGLAITQNLIKLMGGTVEVNSVYGMGSEFIITLPQKCKEEENDAPAFADKSVLLYCRTPLNTDYIARSLKDLAANFHIVSDDSELHNKLTEGDWNFVFAEADLAYTAQHIVKTRQLSAKIVMLSDSYDATYEARDGQDFSILVMPAYFISIVNVLSGGDMGHSDDNRQAEHFIAPDAKILVVDDIPTNLKVAQGLLKIYEIDADICESGKAAIELVLSKEYDIVLMDHMMPEMDGVETVKIIRSLGGKHADLPIAALTANAIVGAREMFLQNGFNDFLSKPIEVTKLTGILAKWLPKEKQKPAKAATTIEEDSTEINIEGINIVKGLTFSGGSTKSYLSTLKIFHKDGLAKLDELKNCVETGNLSLYTTYVHALKSACANIGAETLSEEAKILEAAGIKQDMDFIITHNNGFTASLQKLLENINEAIANNTDQPDDSKALDTDAIKQQLTALKTAMESFDVGEIDSISEALQDCTTHPDIGNALNDILQNAFVGKYKQAIQQIDEL